MLVSVRIRSGGKNHKPESYCFLSNIEYKYTSRPRVSSVLYCTVLSGAHARAGKLFWHSRARESFAGNYLDIVM